MHRDISLQAGRGSPKVAVLDAVHGAETIAQRMACCGLEAEALEVYHHTPSVAGYDLVVAPVHLSPKNPVMAEARRLGKRVITHHQAVGELLGPKLESAPALKVFEVTGTHSKTTTALLLSKMLSARRLVVSHTTRGIELWSRGSSRLLRQGLSITPGNAIPAMEEAVSNGTDALVLELSLGGTGIADFGVLTSFSGDYMIAGRTKWASTAKLQMVSLAKKGSRLVANTDVKISPDVSFGSNGQVRAEPGKIHLGEIGHDGHSIRLSEDLDFPSYQTALAAAAGTAIHNAQEASDLQDQLSGLQLLHEISIDLTSTLDLNSVLVATLQRVQDLLGRMHDLEVLIARTRALQSTANVRDLKLSGDLDRLVRVLEMECRQLHVRYMNERKSLLTICDHAAAQAEQVRASAA